jgi:hypothetical protein
MFSEVGIQLKLINWHKKEHLQVKAAKFNLSEQ